MATTTKLTIAGNEITGSWRDGYGTAGQVAFGGKRAETVARLAASVLRRGPDDLAAAGLSVRWRFEREEPRGMVNMAARVEDAAHLAAAWRPTSAWFDRETRSLTVVYKNGMGEEGSVDIRDPAARVAAVDPDLVEEPDEPAPGR